jgi:hypothetical protein
MPLPQPRPDKRISFASTFWMTPVAAGTGRGRIVSMNSSNWMSCATICVGKATVCERQVKSR